MFSYYMHLIDMVDLCIIYILGQSLHSLRLPRKIMDNIKWAGGSSITPSGSY